MEQGFECNDDNCEEETCGTTASTTSGPEINIQEEGYPTYPTLAMLDIQLELNSLANVTDKSKHEAFSMRYVLDTPLKKMEDAMKVVALVRIHAMDVRSNAGFKEKMLELEGLKDIVDATIEDTGYFYCRLVDLYCQQRFAFYIRLPDKVTIELIDLKELEPRLITTKECGGCKRKPQGKSTLYECKKCKKAAYCNAACRKRDKAFHGRFCPLFVVQAKAAKQENK